MEVEHWGTPIEEGATDRDAFVEKMREVFRHEPFDGDPPKFNKPLKFNKEAFAHGNAFSGLESTVLGFAIKRL